jgi:putative IMPACT (imprinted ancient) family translation regulator
MLEVLLGEGIRNVAVVVTRYFGGTLLGTGGLVRAYSQAVKAGLEHCETGVMTEGSELEIHTDYNGIGKVLYILGQRGISPKDSSYGEDVTVNVLVPLKGVESLTKEITEATCGKAEIEKVRDLYYVQS